MTKLTPQEKHFKEHRYDFALHNPDNGEETYLYLTTEDAKAVADALAKVGFVIDIVATHPEFLGWSIEEITDNWPG